VKLNKLAELITKGTTPTTLGFSFVSSGVNFIKLENINAENKFDKKKKGIHKKRAKR
jgi:type I restriction enzyme S subunit